MGIANPRTMDSLKEEWKDGHDRYPNIIEQAFGEVNHNLHFIDIKAWHSLFGGFPDWTGPIPTMWLRGLLQSVCDRIYDANAFSWYDQGCYQGFRITGKVEELWNDTVNKINGEIQNAKDYIKRNLTDPIQNYVDNNVKPAITDFQSKIGTMQNKINEFANNISAMGNQVNGFQGTLDNFNDKITSFNSWLNDLKTRADGFDSKFADFQDKISGFNAAFNDLQSRANGFDSKLTDFNNKIQSYKSTLDELTSKAQALDTSLTDAKNKLTQYKALIDKLDTRVSSLEGKQPTPTEEKKPFALPSIFKM